WAATPSASITTTAPAWCAPRPRICGRGRSAWPTSTCAWRAASTCAAARPEPRSARARGGGSVPFGVQGDVHVGGRAAFHRDLLLAVVEALAPQGHRRGTAGDDDVL